MKATFALPAVIVFVLCASPWLKAEETHAPHGSGSHSDSNHSDGNHSDQLLILLNHKIALQQLQNQFPDNIDQQSKNLAKQKRRLDKALPVLEAYLKIPPERYPNTSLYHQSLENRSALLQAYGHIVSRFYQLLIGN